jgi:hypothetical protein
MMKLAGGVGVGLLAVAASFGALGGCGDDPKPSGGSSSGSSGSGTSSSSSSSSSGGVSGPGTTHAGCKIFPNDNAWNTDISSAEVDQALMQTVMPNMSPSRGLHPDWGSSDEGYGIPITVGKAATPVPIAFESNYGPRESDKLPCAGGGGDFCYPIPGDAKIEGGGDRHVLFLATDGAPSSCVLYELYATTKTASGFTVASSAIFKLDSNNLRPEGWTSADAAGLPIMPGLVRKEEIDKNEITHALRFTMASTRHAYIHPATHAAGDEDEALPPMGLRLRLKASVAESGFSGPSLTIVKAMKKYGVILADNGSDWYISGEQNDTWDMGALNDQLGEIKGSDFEIVKTGPIVPQPD